MKRKSPASNSSTSLKASKRVTLPDYHTTPSVQDPTTGELQWPAPASQIAAVRSLIQRAATSNARVLLVPDKDADGLSSGAILRHTLLALGLPEGNIDVHFVAKGSSVHDGAERRRMEAYGPTFVFVLDQGTRASPPVVETEGCECVVIDHHHVNELDEGGGFPRNCTYITASTSPPVATTSLLTYHLCTPLTPAISQSHAWLCVLGTHGDLGSTIKWSSPFPDMSAVFKTYTKKSLNEAVSLINAPRRTATYDVRSAWDALVASSPSGQRQEPPSPTTISLNPRLQAAKGEVASETARCTHSAPKFSADGKVAVLRIASAAQVHPVIATRWAGHLRSKDLCMVMVANEGYLPGKVNFSCRVARCAREREGEGGVDLIGLLRGYAGLSLPGDSSSSLMDGERSAERGSADGLVEKSDDGGESNERGSKAEEAVEEKPRVPLLVRLGQNFARGHVQASGGIVDKQDFEELMLLMRIGEKKAESNNGSPSKPKKAKKGDNIDPGQKNTLMGYFGKKENPPKVAG